VIRARTSAPEQRVAHEFRAGYAQGEPEIVLDPRTRAGLATGGNALDDQHVETFGRRIHGGSEARRSRADHNQIVQLGRIDRHLQSSTVAQLGNRRIREVMAFAADHNRRG
jgi:hypothetical protein